MLPYDMLAKSQENVKRPDELMYSWTEWSVSRPQHTLAVVRQVEEARVHKIIT